jgi:ABC-type polysaccharide/polyol phosphate export permease
VHFARSFVRHGWPDVYAGWTVPCSHQGSARAASWLAATFARAGTSGACSRRSERLGGACWRTDSPADSITRGVFLTAIPTHSPTLALVDRAAERRSLLDVVRAIVAYRELVRNLVLKDLKIKYRGSVLGFLWSLVNPLAMVGVYTLAFNYILAVNQPGFPFFILLGVLAWTFFANSAMMSTAAIVDGGSLVKAVRFPRMILPLATVLFNLSQYVLTIVVLLPVMFLLYHRPPSGPMLLFPVFLVLQLSFTVGVALILSAATTFFRDVRHMVEVALSLLFWTTPIVYTLSQVPETWRTVLLLTPMTSFIVAYQQMFYYGRWPDASIWAGALVYGLGTLLVGTIGFRRVEHQLVERL